MPFPEHAATYAAMRNESDVISTAIESLDAQMQWEGVQVVGVAENDAHAFDPLLKAIGRSGRVEDTLRAFTAEMFTYGNFTLVVQPNSVLMWPPDWRVRGDWSVEAEMEVIEAKRTPIGSNGYGTPVLELGREAFVRYRSEWMQGMKSFDTSATIPAGVNAVLEAIGFESWGDDLPRFANAPGLRTEMKGLFEAKVLRPFAAARGVSGTPSLSP